MKVVILLGCIAVALATPIVQDDSANFMIDAFLKGFKEKYASKLEPFHMEDMNYVLDQMIGPIDLKAGFNLTNGQMHGLLSMHRNGEAEMKREGEFAYQEVPIEVDNIKFHYDGETIIPLLPNFKFSLDGEANRFQFQQELTFIDNKPHLVSLEIKEMEGLEVRCHGLIIIDGIVDAIITAFHHNNAEFFRTWLSSVVADQMRDFFDNLPDN